MSAMPQLWRRLQLLFAVGRSVLVGADKVQVQVLDEETLSNISRVEPYGFSYRPKPGGQCYLLFPSGDRSYGVAILIGDKRYQMDLAEGEVGLHDDEGNHVHLKRGGVIEVKAATKVVAQTPLFETSGDVRIGGKLYALAGLEVTGTATANGKNISETHTHTSQPPGTQTSGVN